MRPPSTKEKILDTAEALFAEQGIGGTSIRAIVKEVGANVAAINYHFGSKDELVAEVFRRRLSVINARRLEELNKLREEFGNDPIPVREILRALLAPAIHVGQDSKSGGVNFFRIAARAHAETDTVVQKVVFECLHEVIQEFTAELERAMPELSPDERSMRLGFIVGAMMQAVLIPLKPEFVQKFFPTGHNPDKVLEMLISFCTGGMLSEEAGK